MSVPVQDILRTSREGKRPKNRNVRRSAAIVPELNEDVAQAPLVHGCQRGAIACEGNTEA